MTAEDMALLNELVAEDNALPAPAATASTSNAGTPPSSDPDGLERCKKCQNKPYRHRDRAGRSTKRSAGCTPLKRRYECDNYGEITSVYTRGPPCEERTEDYDSVRWKLSKCGCPCHSCPSASPWVRRHEWMRINNYDAND